MVKGEAFMCREDKWADWVGTDCGRGTSQSRRLTVEEEERQGQPQTVGHSRYRVLTSLFLKLVTLDQVEKTE